MRRALFLPLHQIGLALVGALSCGAAYAQDVSDQSTAEVESPAPPLDPNPVTRAVFDQRKTFFITPGFGIPLSRGGEGATSSGDRSGSTPRGFVDFRYSPRENWFANVTVYGYPDGREEWEPDFTYAFGYDDWRPNTFSLVYANYTNSRFDPEGDERVTRPEFGTISAGYKFQLPDAVRVPSANADDEGRVNCRVGYHYTPRYETQDGPDRSDKQAASVGCRAPLWKRLFVDLTAYDYVMGEQQAWDPDYTYGFGWFDWRPNHFSIQYFNYSGTRFPWRDGTSRSGGFEDGTVTVSYNLAF